MKILIVDDSKAMRGFLENLARLQRCATIAAEDGLHALELLATCGPVDLALIDWDMPRMNGLDLIRTLRADGRYAHMRLMMVTAQNSLEGVSAALDAGANDFLMKPVTRESLEEKFRLLGIIL